jgi:uncharacterized SAM-binding protein YcdF (DUF218 family)
MANGADKPRDRIAPGAARPAVTTAAAAPSSTAQPAPRAQAPRRRSLGTAVGRGIALFMGVFTLVNVGIALRHPGFDTSVWWISLYPLRGPVAELAMLVPAVLWIAFALAPEMGPVRRRATRTSIELLWLFLGWDVLNYYALLLVRHRISTTVPVPMSIVLAVLLWGVWRSALSERPSTGPGAWGVMLLAVAVCALLFPMLLMVCFGLRDHRRPADVAVVFGGAPLSADGTPSAAARQAVDTAVGLYKRKLVSKLVLSGGRGEGGKLSEAEAMRQMAVEGGVNYADTRVDRLGVDTDGAVANVREKLRTIQEDMGVERPLSVVAVDRFYLLPRIKMRFAEQGIDAITVPVRERLSGAGAEMVREVGAMWSYYLEALLG